MTDWVMLIEDWIDFLLFLCALVPPTLGFGIMFSKPHGWSKWRTAIISAGPTTVVGAVIGSWVFYIGLAGVAALLCGISCSWQQDGMLERWLYLVVAVGAVVGAAMAFGFGFLLALTGGWLAAKVRLFNGEGSRS
jgi:hypothetical protein